MTGTPTAQRSLTPAAERLLRAASELFYAQGIRAVGVDTIAETAGTTKKTLYDRFGSKDALVVLYLEERAARWQRHLADHLERHGPGPDRVLAVFDALGSWFAGERRGCAFVNAYAELGGTEHPALAVIRAEKAWTRQLFTDLAAEAGVDDPDGVAAILHLLYEGALVLGTAGDDPGALAAARAAASRVVG